MYLCKLAVAILAIVSLFNAASQDVEGRSIGTEVESGSVLPSTTVAIETPPNCKPKERYIDGSGNIRCCPPGQSYVNAKIGCKKRSNDW